MVGKILAASSIEEHRNVHAVWEQWIKALQQWVSNYFFASTMPFLLVLPKLYSLAQFRENQLFCTSMRDLFNDI